MIRQRSIQAGVMASCFVAGFALNWAMDRKPTQAATPDVKPGAVVVASSPRPVNPGAVKVELFVMSQCPYGVEAEQAFDKVVTELGADIDLRVEYIGDTGPAGNLSSMHGPKEVRGDVLQACAMKHSPKWVEFIACQNEDWHNVDTNAPACLDKLEMPTREILACADGSEGKDLVAASFKRAKERGATGSPTIYVDGNAYEGGRRKRDLMKAVCAGFDAEKPAACLAMANAPPVNVTLLGDKRCTVDCDLTPLEEQTKHIVENPVITKLDYASPEGKKLFDLVKPASLPAVVFDKTIEKDPETLSTLGKEGKLVGDHRVLALGEWKPTCADDGGCKTDECKTTMQCKPEEPNKLEVFVMSQCPFGVQALDAMKEVLANFETHKAKIKFEVHFIGGGDKENGFTSLHGKPEVDENLREICAAQHYGKDFAFMQYVWCRNKNIKSTDWQSCATATTGIDANVIEKCSEGDEGASLLAKSFAYADANKVTGSPTWLVNGKYQFSGVDPETIRANICAHNKLAGCDVKLSGNGPPPAGGAPAPGCE